MSSLFKVLPRYVALCAVAVVVSTCGGGGSGTSSTTTITELALVANSGANNVSVFSIDTSNGQLTPVAGSPFATGDSAQWVTVAPNHKFAYVVNSTSNSVSAFTINSTTGSLTPIAGSPFPTGNYPTSITFDPSGRYAYVPYGLQTLTGVPVPAIDGFAIDSTTGALTALAGSPFPSGTKPYALVFDPSLPFAYLGTEDYGVQAYTFDSSSGSLTLQPGIVAGIGNVTIDPSGKHAYVANPMVNAVSAYTIDPVTGSFSDVAMPNVQGEGVLINQAGTYAYIASATSSASSFSIDASTGALTALGGAPFYGPGMAIDPSGQFLYSTSGAPIGTAPIIFAFAILPANGELTSIPGNTSDDHGESIAVTPVP